MNNLITYFINNINIINILIFCINLLILVFWKLLIKYIDISELTKHPSKESKEKKLKTLQSINIFIASSYILSLFLNTSIFQSIILSLFSILIIYLITNLLIVRITLFYWKEIESNWDTYFQESPTSEIFSFILKLFSIIFLLLIILNIFHLNNLLKAWWVIGWLLAFFWFSANHWAPDIIAGLQLLHSKRIKQWDVIIISKLYKNPLWIKTISLTEVKLIDIITENSIIIKTSNFRDTVIENISGWITNWTRTSFYQYIDLKISYWEKIENIENLCFDAYNNVKTKILNFESGNNILENRRYMLLKRAFKGDDDLYIDIIENWDHAVIYRFSYVIHRDKSLNIVKNTLNTELYKLSQERNIALNTPFSIVTK